MVFIEHNGEKIAEVSLELISEATKLAQKLNVSVTAVAMGYNIQSDLEMLGHYGCKKVYYLNDKRLKHFSSIPYAKNVCDVVGRFKPQIVLFGATVMGRDIAPRVASQLKCGLTADCTELKIGEHQMGKKLYKDTLLQIRPAFGGNIIATIVSPESVPSMATVREGVMKLGVADHSKAVKIEKLSCKLPDEDFMTEVLDIIREEKSVDLKGAQIIVSAGMGASDEQALGLVKYLASTLGGVVGGSRPVVDSGVLAKDHQVGQTGVTVRPNLYIACGISGQIQHRAGMSDAKRIVAINSDPNAPIFSIAHYGIVGDVNNIIPKMIKAYKEKV